MCIYIILNLLTLNLNKYIMVTNLKSSININTNLNIGNRLSMSISKDFNNENDDLNNRNKNTSFRYYNQYLKVINDKKHNQSVNSNKLLNKYESAFKDLKSLTPVTVLLWINTWRYNIVESNIKFPKYIEQDMYTINEFALENLKSNYLYIGFYPSYMKLLNGPYYIGVFELDNEKSILNTELIVQNPNYFDNNYDDTIFWDYKYDIEALTCDASLLFKIEKLRYFSAGRYYLSWKYNR